MADGMAAPDFVMVRLPRELSLLVDAARGDVPRERWVRRALEEALGGAVSRDAGGAPSSEAGSVCKRFGKPS